MWEVALVRGDGATLGTLGEVRDRLIALGMRWDGSRGRIDTDGTRIDLTLPGLSPDEPISRIDVEFRGTDVSALAALAESLSLSVLDVRSGQIRTDLAETREQAQRRFGAPPRAITISWIGPDGQPRPMGPAERIQAQIDTSLPVLRGRAWSLEVRVPNTTPIYWIDVLARGDAHPAAIERLCKRWGWSAVDPVTRRWVWADPEAIDANSEVAPGITSAELLERLGPEVFAALMRAKDEE